MGQDLVFSEIEFGLGEVSKRGRVYFLETCSDDMVVLVLAAVLKLNNVGDAGDLLEINCVQVAGTGFHDALQGRDGC
ncbi:MAG: hypothetical protein H7X97_11560, partial [Opitutaceae bacterium]|nr:hypothetical protein [Verrucomicrobiales bacterium]